MKVITLIILLISHSTFACDLQELRKEVQSHFQKDMPVRDVHEVQRALTNLEEVQVTDSLLNIRGESFFMTKLVFNTLWLNGIKEKKEILFATVVDLGTCQLEEFRVGEILGSTISR